MLYLFFDIMEVCTMTKENKYFNNYGRLEFTVNSVAEGKENDVLFAVYCD